MAASNKTVDEVFETILKYVDDDIVECLIADLLKIKGNKSFVETIKRIAARRVQSRHDYQM